MPRRDFTLLSVHIKILLLYKGHTMRVEIWVKKYCSGCKFYVTKIGMSNLAAKAQVA